MDSEPIPPEQAETELLVEAAEAAWLLAATRAAQQASGGDVPAAAEGVGELRASQARLVEEARRRNEVTAKKETKHD